jgi:hypothetical protein
MSLTNLECQVSELVDSDACPRPTTGDRRAVHPALPAHYGRRGRRGGIPVHPPRRQQEAVGAGDAVPLGPGAQHRPARGRGHQGPWQVLSLSCLPLSLSPSISVFISVCRSVCLHVCLSASLSLTLTSQVPDVCAAAAHALLGGLLPGRGALRQAPGARQGGTLSSRTTPLGRGFYLRTT